jgi:hypothetical protein
MTERSLRPREISTFSSAANLLQGVEKIFPQ